MNTDRYKYEYRKVLYGSDWTHFYQLVGKDGGLHLHLREYKGELSGGIEFHSRKPTWKDVPSDINCWLIKGPCWHDGSSLQVEEKYKHYHDPSNLDYMFNALTHAADDYFYKEDSES